MRNPLGAILLLADSIVTSLPPVSDDAQASVLTPGIRQTLADIAASIHLCANHQKVIVEEILTFSRLDSNLLVLAPEKIRPSETVQTVLRMVKAELDYDNIQGSLQIQQSYVDLAIDNVVLDPGRLSQIILNLMTSKHFPATSNFIVLTVLSRCYQVYQELKRATYRYQSRCVENKTYRR